MQIISSFTRIAFMAIVLGLASVTTIHAQNTPAGAVLTDAEKAQLKKAHDAALAANPDLQEEHDAMVKKGDALKAQGDSASAEDKAALKTEHQAWEEKVHAAMLTADPTLGPIFDKIKAAKKQ